MAGVTFTNISDLVDVAWVTLLNRYNRKCLKKDSFRSASGFGWSINSGGQNGAGNNNQGGSNAGGSNLWSFGAGSSSDHSLVDSLLPPGLI